MPRQMSSAMLAALSATELQLAFMVELQFASGARLCLVRHRPDRLEFPDLDRRRLVGLDFADR